MHQQRQARDFESARWQCRLRQMTNIKKHPNWNTNTLDANYAILHLLADVVGLHDGLVTVASLPETHPAETSGLSVRVAGWDKLDSSAKTLPMMLQNVDRLGADRSSYNSIWGDVNSNTSSMMCFEPNEVLMPETSACNGDTGGPIVDDLRVTVYGVVSYGAHGCTAAPMPNVGSSIYDAKRWIESNIV